MCPSSLRLITRVICHEMCRILKTDKPTNTQMRGQMDKTMTTPPSNSVVGRQKQIHKTFVSLSSPVTMAFSSWHHHKHHYHKQPIKLAGCQSNGRLIGQSLSTVTSAEYKNFMCGGQPSKLRWREMVKRQKGIEVVFSSTKENILIAECKRDANSSVLAMDIMGMIAWKL